MIGTLPWYPHGDGGRRSTVNVWRALSLPRQRTSGGGGGGGGEGGSDGDGPERRVLWVGFVCRLSCMRRASLLSSDSRESCSL